MLGYSSGKITWKDSYVISSESGVKFVLFITSKSLSVKKHSFSAFSAEMM
jgi:hypothetical protein